MAESKRDASVASRLGRRIVISTVGSETVRAFVPPPLPPDPPLRLDDLHRKLDEANQALGRLDGMTSILPDSSLFLYMYIRKEALLSSQIEGTQSSLSDLLLYENNEAPGVPLDDVQVVSNYVAAMEHGLRLLRDGLPLSNRLIQEVHGVLLRHGRGANKQPGEYRRSQNWIGGSRPGDAVYVPPPHDRLSDLTGDLEAFIHNEDINLPILIKAALVHVQFETIHPFLDGNGRLGRLLITFLLCMEGTLREPMLYLSLYFKTHRSRYYALLQRVRESGDWESWLEFFVDGVKETSVQATDTIKQVLQLFETDRKKIEGLGRAAASALRVYQHMQSDPIMSVPTAAMELNMSAPVVRKAVNHLIDLGIVREITGKRRNRVFAYSSYMNILSQGSDPIQ